MRFLILTQYFPPEIGAPQVRLAAVIRELLRLGHQVEVVTALPNYPQGKIFEGYQGHFYKLEQWEGISVHRVWMYTAMGAGINRLLSYFSFMFTALWALRRVQQPDYLLVESPPLFLGITGYWMAKRWHCRFILNVADLWPDFVRGVGLMKNPHALRIAEKLEAWLYQRADIINVVTRGMRDILVQNKQVPARKVLFLPNGIDTRIFYPQSVDDSCRNEFKLSERPLFLYAGTHGYAHGMEVILQAAQQLPQYDFLLVGGGSEKSRLEQLSQQMNLSNVIFFPPQSPETICRLYSLAIAGLATLRAGNHHLESLLSAKLLAIMACGKPVIYSGGTGEGTRLVTAATAGIIVPPEDSMALAQAICDLVQNPEQARQWGEQGCLYIKNHLQWSQIVARWLQQLTTESL